MRTMTWEKILATGTIVLFMTAGVIPVAESVSTEKYMLGGTMLYVGGIGPGNYSHIQDAIDDAADGDTVFVYDNSSPYNENISVGKSITVMGKNRSTTVIDGGVSDSVISITAGSVTISGFTIRSAGGTGHTGIDIRAGNAKISDISISKYSFGISVFSRYNIISNAKITDCSRGIYLDYTGDSNIIYGSTVSRNNEGIYFDDSESNLVICNNISHNSEGIWLNSGYGNTIVHNNIDNITLCNSRHTSIESNNFIGNSKHATFSFSFQQSPFSQNHWSHNYWGGSTGLIPKLIVGNWWIFPWFNFDWQPASKPYEITKNPIVIINTSMGTMEIELYGDKMPITTENFVKLVESRFYDGIIFHRVIDDFVIQGGGYYPDGTYVKSPYGPIELETNPDVMHVDGAISMARTSDPDSATSQFFICDGAQHRLDGQYAAFGKVIRGMDVLRAIASVDTTTKHGMQDWPVDEVVMNSVTLLNR